MAVSQGMRTLRDEAVRLISEDTTTISEVVRSIYAA
jgi:type II secretory ATPase GspE/PulE/Tfp pilus assembly ATPase PilB-like protein